MPFFRRKKADEKTRPQISKEDFLKSIPVRNPTLTWKKYPSGEIAVIIKLEQKKRGFKLVKPPKEKKILLDKVGSFVWELCDGKHTVDDIINELVSKYKLHRREAEASLTLYLRMLSQRLLIGFKLPSKSNISSSNTV